MVEREPAAVRRRAGLDPAAASGQVLCRQAPRPDRRKSPRRCPPAQGSGRPALQRGSGAPGQDPPAPGWPLPPRRLALPARGLALPAPRGARRRFWLRGQEACPAPRPSGPRPRRVRLACPPRARLPRLRRRQPRGGRRGRPSGARAEADPWAGVLGERQGLRVRVGPAVAPRRRGVAWAGRPWGRAPQASVQPERGAAKDGGAGGPQDQSRPGACRAGPGVRRSGRVVLEMEPILLEPVAARRRWAAPAGRRWTPPAGPQGPELVELFSAAPALLAWAVLAVWPRLALAWPQRPAQARLLLEATPAWPRPTASVGSRLLGPVWPQPTALASPQLPVLPCLRLPARASPQLPALAWLRPAAPV